MGGEISTSVDVATAPACEDDEVSVNFNHDEHDLDAFDRSSLAQVKTGHLEANYEIGEELGSGSFGVVHKAKDIRTRGVVIASTVAVKTIPKKKISDPKKVKAEFDVLRHLDHAHICKAYECYEDRRSIYLVMEICFGGTLLEALVKQSRFSETDASNIMRQVLGALAYLHQSNFVFRDLKTENVMFSRPLADRSVGCVKLIDFGLCCSFERGTKIVKAAGTPYSVAPELVTAPVQYDQRCDSWSAGVVMYILLSGQYPFAGKSKDELLHKIRKEPVSFKDRRWKRVSKEAKTLIAECLRKKVDTRCEVIDALTHPWLKLDTSLPDQCIMEEVLLSMQHFQSLNMLQKAAITALAWRASEEDTQQLRPIFESIDRDGSGYITVNELRGIFEDTGVTIPVDLQMLAKGSGTDGNDTIEYTEFIAAAMDKQKIMNEEVVWEAFKIFDQDGSGTVTRNELLKILTGTKGKARGDKAIDKFLDEYDQTGDDVIDFNEFMSMLKGAAEQCKAPRQSKAGGASEGLSARKKSESSAKDARAPEIAPLKAIEADAFAKARTFLEGSGCSFLLSCSSCSMVKQAPQIVQAKSAAPQPPHTKQEDTERKKRRHSKKNLEK
eukprot:TRINITY_DN62592_c0_g1_i1.p1 TRINITY_DN62592_c0_g1~~TRINITY_DN62592_c0_g1_i1.p1  ORF type:complete len:619 (+),score=128.28 TRINITY_DN62592_c0_g1_i1:26-1858(+)